MATPPIQRKKGKKKNKGTVVSLQSFLSNGDAPVGTTQVSKIIRDVDAADSDDGSSSLPQVYQLPNAPRASRDFDDDSIPHKPPFIAYVFNLPFDANEDDIYDLFGAVPIISLRLPRADGETGRVRGFANVEFDSRDDFISILNLPDPSIKGRKIRIELSKEQEKQSNRQRYNRRSFDGFGNSDENPDSTNWRSDKKNQDSGGGGYGKNYERDRGFSRERESVSEESSAPGLWRNAERLFASNLSAQTVDQGDDRQRNFDRYRNRPIGSSYRNEDDSSTHERPKLNLKSRTLPPLGIIKKAEATTNPLKSGGIPSDKVFGSAKPVDTAARELEIEERLAKARLQGNKPAYVNEKPEGIHIEQNNENTRSAISWRRRDDTGNYSPDSNKSELPKSRPQQRKDSKTKRNVETNRPMPQYQPTKAPGFQSSNKYAGLDDEASD